MRINFIYIWGNYISKIIPGKLFNPRESQKIIENLFAVRDKDVNIFIYSDKKNTICIDTGYMNNYYLKDEFEKIGIDPKSVTHLFLTHTDMDHAGGIDSSTKTGWFNKAELYVGKNEDQLINRTKFRRFFFYTPVTIYRDYKLLQDGEIVNVGNIKVKAIASPGHTPGHMSYLINDNILCTGDALILKEGKAKPFYFMWNNDQKAMRESIRKLAKLENITIMCTAHSGWAIDYKSAMEEWSNPNISA